MTMTRKASVTKALGSGDNRFIFKKRLFRHSREISQDPVEVSLLYAQAVYSVVRKDDFPVTEKVALQLAGLQLQVSLGEYRDDRGDCYKDLDLYLPQRISKSRPETEWQPLLSEAHRRYGTGKPELVAKVWYLSCVMQYPLYGTSMFAVTYRGYWSYGNNVILGVSCDGVCLIKPDDKIVMYEHRYCDIESVLVDPSDDFLTINLVKTLPNSHRCFVFETTQKQEIGSLIASYSPLLAGWIKDSDVPLKKVNLTAEDRLRLHHNVVNCRRLLIDHEVVRKAHEDYTGFIKSTLRRLGRNKTARLREDVTGHELGGETYRGYPYGFWAFSKTALLQPITRITDPDLISLAIQVFKLMLTYAGLLQNGEAVQITDADHITMLQTIMERCMKKDALLEELYLQLTKQTTDHPDPNSRVNLRHWALMALACSVVLPRNKLVRRYLNAHLKKCAGDFITEEGKFARFAEKCFHKTSSSTRRQWPPSRQEVMCVISRRPIYARIHSMDGQFHAVEFDSTASAKDVMKTLMEKLGLRDGAKGYALYEMYGIHERSISMDEKLSEVLSKWEKMHQSSISRGSKKRPPENTMLLFKKHLFVDTWIDLSDAVEKELLYHQTLHQLRNDRYPVCPMEAVMLCALYAQVELGNHNAELDMNYYRAILQGVLSPRLLGSNQVSEELVSQHHQSLVNMTGAEAKQAFLNIIQSWPLHKATVFDVSQSFTSNWARHLWLAVEQKGIHLVEAGSRHVMCSFEYSNIQNISPSLNSLMLITGSQRKQSKIILHTKQGPQIADLIRDYADVITPSTVDPTTRHYNPS